MASVQSLLEENVQLRERLAEMERAQKQAAKWKEDERRMERQEMQVMLAKEARTMELYRAAMRSLQARSMLDNEHYCDLLLKYPARPISDTIEMYKKDPLLMTTLQRPYCIEFVNKKWCDLFEWGPNDVLGYTCGFLDGPLTDKLITSTYREQVSACGYGCMTAINYTKNGKAFVVTATTFPVFDSICATGRDSDQSSLTHIATIFSNILDIETTFGNSEQLALAHVQRSNQPLFKSEAFVQQPKIAQAGPRRSQGRGHGSGGPGSGQGQGQGLEHRGHGHVHKRTRSTASESCGEAQHAGGGSRRSPSPGLLNGEFTQSSHRAPESEIVHQQDQGNTHELTQADFVKIGQSARLADILRIMIVCKNPMVMTDSSGKILHLNRTWTEFCGYNLQDMEGLDNNVLQGPDTDMAEVGKCMSEVHRGNVGTMNVVNYKKNGSAYRATVMIIPLQGGYLNPATTHFYACLWPENECA